MNDQEEIILSNSVGTITTHLVKIKPAKGRPATLNIADIKSVKYQLKRKFHYAALFLFFGLGALFTSIFPGEGNRISIVSFLIPVLLIIGAIANLLGYYTIEIETNAGTVKLEDVEFTKLKDARVFIEALEKVIPAKSEQV